MAGHQSCFLPFTVITPWTDSTVVESGELSTVSCWVFSPSIPMFPAGKGRGLGSTCKTYRPLLCIQSQLDHRQETHGQQSAYKYVLFASRVFKIVKYYIKISIPDDSLKSTSSGAGPCIPTGLQ